jgi:ficolin
VYKTEGPESGIFDIPDVCGGQTNSFFKEVPKTQARCDFQNGGGWTVILRRNANVTRVSFNHTWSDYEGGFGDLNSEFWYGLRNIHCLTEREEVELQIEVRQDNGTGQVWTYGYFEVDGPETNYTLHIGQAQGPSDGQDSMAIHNGMQFTTTDRDNDLRSSGSSNCASHCEGSGWWYKSCYRSILTGSHSSRRLHWVNRYGRSKYYPFADMRLRPKNCKTIEVCN